MLQTAATDDLSAANLAAGGGLRTLIHMDDPLHRDIRKIGADWFRPKAMRALKTRVDELAKIYVDKMVEKGPECDFVQEVAVNFPLYVILSLLGLPESDFGRMLKLTQELFGGDDDELSRGKDPEELHAVILDFFQYFTALTAERRAHPTEDLASAIANATLDGEPPLNDIDCLSYYVIVASAGHDTTSAAISGGLLALIEHQDQLARLKAQPDLMGTAVEEIIRWTAPVKEFMRTATADTEVRGVPIREASRCCCPTSRPTGTRKSSTSQPHSMSGATRTSTCPSATASTSASVPPWPAWRSTASSPSCCRDWSPSNWPVSRSSSRRSSSAASSICRSGTRCADAIGVASGVARYADTTTSGRRPMRLFITGVDADGKSCVVSSDEVEINSVAPGFGIAIPYNTTQSPPPARPQATPT